MPELTISGRLLTSSTIDDRNNIFKEMADKLAADVELAIHYGFNRSVQLMSMVGASSNQEAVRAILRSLKVKVKTIDPMSLEAKFEDDLAHWTGADQGIPDDVSKMLQEIIDTSISNWLKDGNSGKIIAEVMNAK